MRSKAYWWFQSPQQKEMSSGIIWSKAPRVYQQSFKKCPHRLRRHNGMTSKNMVLHRTSFFGCPLKYCDPMIFPPQKPTNLPVRPRSKSSVHGCSRFIQNCKKAGVRHLILTPQSYHWTMESMWLKYLKFRMAAGNSTARTKMKKITAHIQIL